MPFHVLTAEFVHESNTFKKGETELQRFPAMMCWIWARRPSTAVAM